MRTAKHQQVTVSLPALTRRINRALSKQCQQLRKTRGADAIRALGDYHVIDYRKNYPIDTDVDPETFGRELGVLKQWEGLSS